MSIKDKFEGLKDKAAKAYNELGANPPHFNWMDGYVAGLIADNTVGKKYKIIYADPAWSYSGQLFNRGGVKDKYQTLHKRNIEQLNVNAIAHTDSVLFMWATYPKLEEALYIMRGWGFRYVTTAFTWVKTYEKSGKPFFGMGKWTRANSEICLLGTKGNISRVDASVPQVILSPVGEHSKKPDEVRQRILKLMGDLPRIELFAREKHIGWDAWGDEIQNDIEIPFNNFNAQEDEK